MKTKEISKSEANNLEKKISCFDIKNEANTKQNIEKNFTKEYYENLTKSK